MGQNFTVLISKHFIFGLMLSYFLLGSILFKKYPLASVGNFNIFRANFQT
jgi:hypothetical protein